MFTHFGRVVAVFQSELPYTEADSHSTPIREMTNEFREGKWLSQGYKAKSASSGLSNLWIFAVLLHAAYRSQLWRAALGESKTIHVHFSGQFFFQPTPVLCSGPPSHLSWFCSSSLTSLSCPMELGHPLSYCGWWWPCSSPQFIFSFVLGGSRMLLVALICLIQCSKQSLRSRQRVRNCNLLSFSSPSLPSTSFILSRPKTFSPTTPKRGCCPQMLGIGDTFHCDSVSKYDSKLACCSYPFLVPAV